MGVERGKLDGGVQGGGGGAADEQGRREPPGGHLAAEFLHLVQRGRDQPADADDVRADLLRPGQDGLARHHHAEVGDFEAVAAQHDAEDVLADVVHVALYGGEQDARFPGAFVGGAHIGLQDFDGVAHHLGGLDHLRQEHLARGEAFAHPGHPVHQRTLDDVHRPALFLQGLQQVFPQGRGPAADERADEPFRDVGPVACSGAGVPARLRLPRILPGGRFLRQRDQAFRGAFVAVQDHVLDGVQQARLHGVVGEQQPGVDDAHVQPGGHGVVKESGVHRLADGVVAPEGEGKVGDAAGAQRPRQVRLDPADGLDEIHRITGVLRNAGADGQDVDVENDIPGFKTGLFRQQAEGPPADGDLAFIDGGLAFFVEGHHDHGGAQAADFPRPGQEDFLSLLEGQ